jgi:hypothetical protein
MITAASGVTSADGHIHLDAWGPVTAGERAARWGHRGAVLKLTGPAELIDSIERSLFSAGTVTNRIEADDEAFLLHPGLLELVARLQVQSGLLALVVTANEGDALLVRAEDHELTLDASDPIQAISAVHQLLHEVGIFISWEKAGL